jgi:hypothetical protein
MVSSLVSDRALGKEGPLARIDADQSADRTPKSHRIDQRQGDRVIAVGACI